MRILGRFFVGSAGAGPFSRRARAGLALKVTLAVWAVVLMAAAVLKAFVRQMGVSNRVTFMTASRIRRTIIVVLLCEMVR